MTTPTQCGSGFLIEFEENGRTRKGFLTCHHVIFQGSVEADLAQVILDFQNPHYACTLADIKSADFMPKYESNLDYYYVEVSDQFSTNIENEGIRFLRRNLGRNSFNTFFLVHYPGGKQRTASIGEFFIFQHGNIANSDLMTRVNSEPGSGGGALIEPNKDAFVFAMHTGASINETVKHSTLIAYIIADITGQDMSPWGMPDRVADSFVSVIGIALFFM